MGLSLHPLHQLHLLDWRRRCLLHICKRKLIQLKNTITEHLHDAFPAHKDQFYLSKELVSGVLVFGFMFPFSLCRRLSGIKLLSSLTLLSTLAFLVFSFLSLFLYLPEPPAFDKLVWFHFDFFSLI